MKVLVLGAGYVGLVSGTCLANSGHEVTVLDVDAARIETLNAGRSPIHEPGLDELIASSMDAGRLTFGMMPIPEGCDAEVVIVAVGTPMTEVGAADLSFVRGAVSDAAARVRPGATLVMKSTVTPGTGTALMGQYLTDDIRYASNPEFLREGSAIQDWHQTDRIVVGAQSAETFDVMRRLYADIAAPIVECDIASAEMIKYASNAFLAMKISFINEVATLCDLVGADVETVAQGVGLDARIGASFLKAGIGYGGSCFPKDTRALDYLAAANGYDFHLLKAVIEVNARQRMLPMMTLVRKLGGIEGKRIALLGLTFKPHTDDTRESPGLDVAQLLTIEGADVVAHDPVGRIAGVGGITQVPSVEEALAGAHGCVVAVEWDEYSALDWSVLAPLMQPNAIVFDGRNCLDGEAVRSAGLIYQGVGRP